MPEIKEIQGVWSAKEVTEIKNWVTGAEGTTKIKESQNLAKEQSKSIKEISHVEVAKLREPFTFNY